MPKKHRQTYQHQKPGSNYVHPSLGGSPRLNDTQPKPTLSVNERLTNLRLAQASPASHERKRQLAELSSQRSLPPNLGQGILGQVAAAAPIPRSGQQQRSRIRFRTPGPAPPPSWVSRLTSHRQALENRYYPAPRQPRSFGTNGGTTRPLPHELARFLNMVNDNPVTSGSLLDLSLRAVAKNWADVVEDCYDTLDVIPTHLRVVLLSYLTYLGPAEGVDMAGLHALFPNPAEASALDLTGLIGWCFTLKDLRRWLHKSTEESRNQLQPPQANEDGIAESWDQDSSPDESTSRTFSIPPSLDMHIQHLTKLSLANPPPSASWTDLLSLSKDLNTITHLSLANWPFPTRTPNSTSPYASLDRDFEEPALVLRILATNTYCLRWLDLQNCHSWLPALTYRSFAQPLQTFDSDTDNDWTLGHQRPKGPDWNTSWRHVTYLNMSQASASAWFPCNTAFLKSALFRAKMSQKYFRLQQKHHRIISDLRDFLALHPQKRELQSRHCSACHVADAGACGMECVDCNSYQDVFVGLMARWLEQEVEARNVGRAVIAMRSGSGLRCAFDHGWQCTESYPVL